MTATLAEEVQTLRHLTGLDGVSRGAIVALLDRGQALLDVAMGALPPLQSLRGATVANVFFESSTRTRCSFTFADFSPQT